MAQTDCIIGEESGLRTVMKRVGIVSCQDIPVLLHGETGTGKEVIALAIHTRSPKKNGPFKRVNCGAIASELIDSELFGHEQGAFTGAVSTHKGWFEQADGGTLFLDEVAELSASAQVRLLRVLQEGEFNRVGGEKTLHVNVRIIAATHKNLPKMIEKQLFRSDLYYRLAVFPIVIPPLRERKDDFFALTKYFTDRAVIKFGLKSVSIDKAHVDALSCYFWPGNIREFAAVIDRAVLLGETEGTLEVKAALGLTSPVMVNSEDCFESDKENEHEFETLDEVMRRHVESTVAACHGRIEGPFGAARRLGLNPSTLRSKMRKWKNR